METFSITTILWLIASGAVIGYIVGIIMRKEGIGVDKNILWGMGSTVGIGGIFLLFELSGVMLYAFIGTLAFLFIVNVFHFHHLQDVLGSETAREPRREL